MLNKIEKKLYCTKKTKTYFTYHTILAEENFKYKLYLNARIERTTFLYDLFHVFEFLFYSFYTNFLVFSF
jgi:hypothetical protein